MINIHAPENAQWIRKSPNLFGYVEVVQRERGYQAQGMSAQDALRRAIEDCVGEGILADYLREHASEVIGMLTEEFSLEEFGRAMIMDGKKEGVEIGEASGAYKKSLEIARRLREMSIDVDAIVSATNLSKEEILRL